MTSSKTIQFAIIATIFSGILLSASADNFMCECETDEQNQCISAEVKTPTWWGWLTDSNKTQFHFFDLIELLYGDEQSYPEFSDHSPSKNISFR